MQQSALKGAFFALLGFAVFSSHDAVIKYLGADYAPFQILFFSILLSFPFATLLLMRDKDAGTLRPKNPKWVAVRTIAMVITSASVFYAFSVLPLAQVYAFIFAAPMLITVLSIPILGEKVGVHRWAAVVLGLVGVMIVLRPGGEPLTLGHIAGLVAAAGHAVVSVVTRKIGQQERAAVLMLYPMMTNILLMGCILPFVYKPMPIEHLGLLAIVSFLGFSGGLCVIAAYRFGDAAVVAPMQYSQIVWGSAFGFLFFAETPDSATGIGAAVIIAAGLYVVIRESLGGGSKNTPVLRTRGRTGSPSSPNIGAILRAQTEQALPGHEALAKARKRN
ncbi:DMT family transporter [Rhodobacteraceae bacterium]|nr:DMT family transporter [Paracoccaceae bacterium]